MQFKYPVELQKIRLFIYMYNAKRNTNQIYDCPGFPLSYVSLECMYIGLPSVL